MIKRNRILVAVSIVTAFLALGLFADEFVKLPGINAEDQHARGCIDCHTRSGDSDYRLNTTLEEMSGHPPIDASVKVVPTDCTMCHKAGLSAAALSTITHKSHYQNPSENGFVNYYQGQCLECHRLNVSTGAMSVKNGPKNW